MCTPNIRTVICPLTMEHIMKSALLGEHQRVFTHPWMVEPNTHLGYKPVPHGTLLGMVGSWDSVVNICVY
jgi:hypothetical protein